MAKLSKPQFRETFERLRLDLITAESTRPAGKNDRKPPHEVLAQSIKREVAKKLNAIDTEPEKLEEQANKLVNLWNNYLTFAFDKDCSIEFYREHKTEIKVIVDEYQKGLPKNQLDRQLCWRFKKQPKKVEVLVPPEEEGGKPEKFMAPNPLAAAYQDEAIAHNAGFIMGTIGSVLAARAQSRNMDAVDFAADAIATIKDKMLEYDPSQTAFSTYMTNPIKWGMYKALNGNAQQRFDRRMSHSLNAQNDDGQPVVVAVAPEERDATDGLSFADDQSGAGIIKRLRIAGGKLTSERARKVFAYKIDHPTAILEEVGKAVGCTRENVRQALAVAGEEITRIDPELAQFATALINRDEDNIDPERLTLEYKPTPLQQEVAELVAVLKKDMARMKRKLGAENVVESDMGLVISRAATRGKPELKQVAAELQSTHYAIKALEEISTSPYVDAGFDVMSLRKIQGLAFYTGSSKPLEEFIHTHLEEIANAGRDKVIAESGMHPEKLTKAKKLVDTFLDSRPDQLTSKFIKNDLNALFCAPSGTEGEVLDKDDLMIVRKIGVAFIKKQELVIDF
jgi:hypothetical protein